VLITLKSATDSKEILSLKSRATNKTTVNILLSEDLGSVRRLARATVKDWALSSSLTELSSENLADISVDLLSLLCGCSLTGTDSPNWLISDNEVSKLLLSKVVNYLLNLSLANSEVVTSLALLEALAYAVDWGKTVSISLSHLLVKSLRGLTIVLATLRVTENNILATKSCNHRSCNLTGVSTLSLSSAILRTYSDI
jgi:hypothetical protein